MGHVRSIPQKTQDGNESGQVSLEITYGGKESPFGGIDTSAPAAYIDPRCFTDADGFFISDNQLNVATWNLIQIPTLWNSVANVKLLKMGTFYNSIYGDINYALGVIQLITGDGGAQYTYYMTAWNYIAGVATLLGNDVLVLKTFPYSVSNIAASLVVQVVTTYPVTAFTISGTLALDYAVSGVFAGTVSVPYVPGDTLASVVPAMVIALNAASGATGFSAAPSLDGTSIILTAVTPGSVGNTLQIADNSTNTTFPGQNPAFYFPIPKNPIWTALVGGANSTVIPFPFIVNPPVTTIDVGGTLYIGNVGPYILKYSGPGKLNVSSFYSGYKSLGKFAGSLIGLGTILGQGTVDNSDMIINWTAANNLDEWNPVSATGLVTGAGFTQLDDIGDRLTSLIVTNNTAFIIRSQGVSYATAIGSGKLPFSFAHVGLAQEGEGAQNAALVCQYNETGAFIGNSNVYKVSGQIQEIGDKIASSIFPALSTLISPVGAAACQVNIGKRYCVVAAFLIGTVVYLFNTDNGTWMQFSYQGLPNDAVVSLTVLSGFSAASAVEKQTYLCLVSYSPSQGTTVYALQEGYTTRAGNISPAPQITFPQEELLFGRDVVVNSVYFSMNAVTTLPEHSTTVSFKLNTLPFSIYTLETAFWNTLATNPNEVYSYPSSVNVQTFHSPQLQLVVNTSSACSVRISKIQLYASMEPEQRPVS